MISIHTVHPRTGERQTFLADDEKQADNMRQHLVVRGLDVAHQLTVKDVFPYSDGSKQVVLFGSYPELGEVTTYSDGKAETTVNV